MYEQLQKCKRVFKDPRILMEKLAHNQETSMSAEMQDRLFEGSEASHDAKLLKEKLARYRQARTSLFNLKQESGSDSVRLAEKQATDEEASTLAEKLERYTVARARKLKENPAHGKNTNTLVNKLERFRISRGFKLDQYDGRLPINTSPFAEVRMV